MARDSEDRRALRAHQEWLGYLQPVGLVVSPAALLEAQAFVNRNVAADQARFFEVCEDGDEPALLDFPRFAREALGWESGDLLEPPHTLSVHLPEYGETLRPTYAVREFDRQLKDKAPWLMLVEVLPTGHPLDGPARDRPWQASPQARFERLLRGTQVPTGLLCNGTHLRLVYAPPGESSGHLTFPVQAMTEVAGRPIFAALHMLCCAERLFSLPPKQRLTAVLAESRRYQNTVSTKLAQQVLAALHELLRGFQAANERSKGELLRDVLAQDPDRVYRALLTVLMRLVFLLYAEDRGLMSGDPVYVQFYSVSGLFERLRADDSRHPDTMDQRYGAWAQLLTLFRLVHDGARHGSLKLPARHGYLFDYDKYPFLEGQSEDSSPEGSLEAPLVSDGCLFRVLSNLLILDGERLSYRALDVEHIGSVYETMMGFNLNLAVGRSIAVKCGKVPVTIDLDELLREAEEKRSKWLKDRTDLTLTGKALNELKSATTTEDVVSALGARVDREATPNLLPPGAMYLQPGDERRKSGLHYTPRSLTEPIVRKTLEPVLGRLKKPTPEQILDLKVADVAVGTGAFLVETCRQLGDALVEAWHLHGCVPAIPADEDEVLHARRLVAERCVYGVDKNPTAIELTKLSLWLATLARDHDFTFLDHALRVGDSLVGLLSEQAAALHWKPQAQPDLFRHHLRPKMEQVLKCRQELHALDEFTPTAVKEQKLRLADTPLTTLRLAGDTVVAAYFAEGKEKQREGRLGMLSAELAGWVGEHKANLLLPLTRAIKEVCAGPHPLTPFHWPFEFLEVFARENPGFDAIVGNPPFLGGMIISTAHGDRYKDWLYATNPDSGNRMDLVAYFFRRAFALLRQEGALGLIATNTIAQGDTRKGGCVGSAPTAGLSTQRTSGYSGPAWLRSWSASFTSTRGPPQSRMNWIARKSSASQPICSTPARMMIQLGSAPTLARIISAVKCTGKGSSSLTAMQKPLPSRRCTA